MHFRFFGDFLSHKDALFFCSQPLQRTTLTTKSGLYNSEKIWLKPSKRSVLNILFVNNYRFVCLFVRSMGLFILQRNPLSSTSALGLPATGKRERTIRSGKMKPLMKAPLPTSRDLGVKLGLGTRSPYC